MLLCVVDLLQPDEFAIKVGEAGLLEYAEQARDLNF